jgi:hypothetical protein
MSPSNLLGPTAGTATGGAAMAANGSSSMSFRFGVPADDLTPFAREKKAFRDLLASGALLAFQGQFVAVHQGCFAGANPSQRDLVRRFFREHDKRASVYIGFVGPRRVVRVRPFAVRHRTP